jgi:hypothetical protein
MGGFMGGSAWAMAKDIAGGYILVTQRTFQQLSVAQIELLSVELNRRLRDIRGEQPSLDDLAAIQSRNRRIQRVTTANMIMQTYRRSRRI